MNIRSSFIAFDFHIKVSIRVKQFMKSVTFLFHSTGNVAEHIFLFKYLLFIPSFLILERCGLLSFNSHLFITGIDKTA